MCEIAAVKFKATFQGQTLEKNYIAKYAPEGPKGDFIKEVINTHLICKCFAKTLIFGECRFFSVYYTQH